MIFIEPEINIGEISSVVTWLRKAMLSTTIYSLVLLIIFFTNKDFRNITTEFLKRIKSKLFSKTSYFDFKQEEANYHMFVLGMLIQMKKHYKIKSNLEVGRGRTDVFVIPKEKNKLGFIFEFKVSKSEEELEEKATEALKQIDEKNYSATMQDEEIKNYYKIGISFYKKQVKVAYEAV